MLDSKLDVLQERLLVLESKKNMDAAKGAIKAVIGLIVPNPDNLEFRLFRDGDGKLTANSSWFFHDDEIADRRATYTLDVPENSNLDVRIFGVAKPSTRIISWVAGLTPNFEDEPFNGAFNVGIDFIIPGTKDRIIVALSKNYVIRAIELKGHLTTTFLEIFSDWAKIKDLSRKSEFHTMLWNSLDLHPINKRFYEGISQRFIALRQHLETTGIFDTQHSAQFSSRLIGRIIFAWFLKKKSLINGEIEYFSSELFEDATQYYHRKLESLFFEVLNTPVGERRIPDVTTPYLNGGLFEPKKEDLYQTGKLTFPRNYFDDLFQFLKGYNFTTDESTSDFQQVAIDPEMLGRIFENLLAEVSEETGDQARKAKGAFYTPREIVDFMCKESLKAYLRQKIPNDANLDRSLYQLIDASERQFQDQDHNWRRDLRPYKDQLIDALDNLRVFDPACGSGAFPIGMMQLLVRVYARLEPRFDHHKAKLAIIEKNIYGADIEPMAAEISRLRAWLALVVDEEVGSKGVKPLPNLDFKFIAANSLLPLPPEGQLSFFEDNSLDIKLQQLRDQFFNTENFKIKAKLKEKYSQLAGQEISLFGETPRTSKLKTFKPFESDSIAEFFDSKEMFGLENFDIVIGNPPYVRQEKIRYKSQLNNYKLYQSTADLYTYFYELGLRNLGEGGVLSFITSSKFGRALYGEKLRSLLAKETTITTLVDFGTRHVFAAITNTWVVQCLKTPPSAGSTIEVKTDISKPGNPLPQSQLSDSAWSFADGPTSLVLKQIESSAKPLALLSYQISYGLKTGCNEGFVVDERTRNSLVKADPKSAEIIKPLLRGRDIGRFTTQEPSTWILVTKNGLNIARDYPSVANYLEIMNAKLGGRLTKRSDQGSHWMNLRDCTYYDQMESTKIVWLELSDQNKFALSDGGEYILAGAWMIVGPNLEALLAVLNSKVVRFYFNHISNSSGMGTTQWKKFAVERLPIPEFEKLNRRTLKSLMELVAERNRISSRDDAARSLEEDIDLLVYSLYELDAHQIELIESTLSVGD